MDNLLQTVEPIIFSEGDPLKRSEILKGLHEDVKRKDLEKMIDELAEK